MVCPHDEGQKPQNQYAANHQFVTPNRAARVVGNNFCHHADGRENEHIHFRVTEEPK